MEHPSRSRLNDLDSDTRPAHNHPSAVPRRERHAHAEQQNVMRCSQCEELPAMCDSSRDCSERYAWSVSLVADTRVAWRASTSR